MDKLIRAGSADPPRPGRRREDHFSWRCSPPMTRTMFRQLSSHRRHAVAQVFIMSSFAADRTPRRSGTGLRAGAARLGHERAMARDHGRRERAERRAIDDELGHLGVLGLAGGGLGDAVVERRVAGRLAVATRLVTFLQIAACRGSCPACSPLLAGA